VAGYNAIVLMLGRAHLTMALTVLVVAFVSFHPYLDQADLCGLAGCPEVSQSAHGPHAGFSTACLVAVLAASGARALAGTSFFGRRRADDYLRPPETYLAPAPPPPRVFQSR
jgi:hypothetical protein